MLVDGKTPAANVLSLPIHNIIQTLDMSEHTPLLGYFETNLVSMFTIVLVLGIKFLIFLLFDTKTGAEMLGAQQPCFLCKSFLMFFPGL